MREQSEKKHQQVAAAHHPADVVQVEGEEGEQHQCRFGGARGGALAAEEQVKDDQRPR